MLTVWRCLVNNRSHYRCGCCMGRYCRETRQWATIGRGNSRAGDQASRGGVCELHNSRSLAALLTCMLEIVSFPVTEINSAGYQNAYKQIKNASPNGDEMLLDGKAPLPGQFLKLPNLGKTFREVAEKGKDGFYKGRVAQAIVDLIQSQGGVMELEDLANHSTDFVEPIKYTFNEEVTVYEVIMLAPSPFNLKKVTHETLQCPPNGQGITALLALGLLDNLEEQGKISSLLEMEHNSAEYLHILVESMRCVLPSAVLRESC